MSASSQFNFPVFNYAVGWWRHQPANPLSFIAPVVKVDGQMGTFKRYPQGSVYRAVDTRRARLNPYNSIDLEAEDVPYLLEDHGLRIGVDDSEIKLGAGDKKEATDQIAQSRMGSLLGTWRTSMISAGFDVFRAAVTATTSIGSISNIGQWSGASNEPVKGLRAVVNQFAANNGVYPNRFLFSKGAWDILGTNASILDLIAYNDAKVLTPELLLKLLDLTGDDVNQDIKVMRAIVPVGKSKPGPGVAFDGEDMMGNDVWITYAEDVQSTSDISGLKTLSIGGEDMVESVETYYVQQDHATWYEVAMARQFVVSAPSAVYRLTIS